MRTIDKLKIFLTKTVGKYMLKNTLAARVLTTLG